MCSAYWSDPSHNEKDKGKVWTVRSDPWECCGVIVVLLEGKPGGYAVDGLRSNVYKMAQQPVKEDTE